MSEKPEYERGCYFDGAFGWYYNTWRIINFAEELGFEWNDPIEYKDSEQDFDGGELEALVDVVDEISTWLDENTETQENEHWAWEDGNYGLWLYDEDGFTVDD